MHRITDKYTRVGVSQKKNFHLGHRARTQGGEGLTQGQPAEGQALGQSRRAPRMKRPATRKLAQG